MADFNENININVRSDTKQAVRDINAFNESLKKMQSTMQKTEVSTRSINKWVKQLENVANPIEFANKQMDRLNKKLVKAQSGVEVKRITRDQVALMTATGQSENFQSAYRQESGIIKAQQALAEFERRLDPTREKLYQLQQKLEASRDSFVKLASAGENTAGVEESIKKIKGQMQELEESTNKTSSKMSVLWGRIKNIAIYRAIRTLLKAVTSGFQEGLNNFVQYSDSANKTVSNLNASLKQIRNTMGITLAQTLTALEPIITRIADLFVDLLNSFNLAMAKMQGKNVYSKAKKSVEDYAKSLQKVQKLSFDSFETLSGGDGKANVAEMFEDASVFGDENALSKTFEIVFKLGEAFGNILEALGGIKTVVITLIGMGIGKLVTAFIGSLGSIKLGLLNAKVGLQEWNLQCSLAKSKMEILQMSWKTLTVAILSSVIAIVSIVKNWDSMSKQTKGWVIAIASITGAVAALSFAILAATGQWAKAFTVAGGIVTTGATVLTAISGFENGGIPDKSELFYMNENGVPEALVNTGGSQTNVINIDQLSEGMRRGFVQAIYDTGLLTAMQQGSSTIMVDKDVLGRTVAESAGFRNEVNRRNVSLNLR